MMQSSTSPTTKKKKNLTCLLLFTASLFTLLFFISTTHTSQQHPLPTHPKRLLLHNHHPNSPSPPPPPPPPSVAYFISGADGDAHRLLRLLHSIYHPNNHYLLHLDRTAHHSQRINLVISIQAIPAFRFFDNVNVVGNPDFANPRGSSALSSVLRGAAILIRYGRSWDWFVHLSAQHYPLVTQDDLLHLLSFQPKELNFVNHSSYIGWRESRRLKPIVVDPGLYLSENSDVFYGTQKRLLPSAFRLFTGFSFADLVSSLDIKTMQSCKKKVSADQLEYQSTCHHLLKEKPKIFLKYLRTKNPFEIDIGPGSASAILSRKFIEFCILGSDNLPRTVLMYLSNTLSARANYFQTVLCNSREFKRTVVNHNLQYSSGDEFTNSEQRRIGTKDFNQLIQSGAAFASEFTLDDPVLDQIDREVLNRKPGRIAPGGWCLGNDDEDPCKVWGDSDILRPGPGARRLEKLMVKLLSNDTLLNQRCQYE
ncbi:hypothetical protein Scep_010427 [Stephania cephalantha]|uniref:Uncharacterized protein n=1 Tax=Stephania cephalantha TaxID=152367 RepID=A0AAP0JVE9_9MAGN